MTFKQATDRLRKAGVLLTDVAAAFDVTPNTVSRWRSGAGLAANRNAFNPPADWPATLADLAVRHAVRRGRQASGLQVLAGDLIGPDSEYRRHLDS